MEVRDILSGWLREHHYDGLCNMNQCACELGSLMPSEKCTSKAYCCVPGYARTLSCDKGCKVHISEIVNMADGCLR